MPATVGITSPMPSDLQDVQSKCSLHIALHPRCMPQVPARRGQITRLFRRQALSTKRKNASKIRVSGSAPTSQGCPYAGVSPHEAL